MRIVCMMAIKLFFHFNLKKFLNLSCLILMIGFILSTFVACKEKSSKQAEQKANELINKLVVGQESAKFSRLKYFSTGEVGYPPLEKSGPKPLEALESYYNHILKFYNTLNLVRKNYEKTKRGKGKLLEIIKAALGNAQLKDEINIMTSRNQLLYIWILPWEDASIANSMANSIETKLNNIYKNYTTLMEDLEWPEKRDASLLINIKVDKDVIYNKDDCVAAINKMKSDSRKNPDYSSFCEKAANDYCYRQMDMGCVNRIIEENQNKHCGESWWNHKVIKEIVKVHDYYYPCTKHRDVTGYICTRNVYSGGWDYDVVTRKNEYFAKGDQLYWWKYGNKILRWTTKNVKIPAGYKRAKYTGKHKIKEIKWKITITKAFVKKGKIIWDYKDGNKVKREKDKFYEGEWYYKKARKSGKYKIRNFKKVEGTKYEHLRKGDKLYSREFGNKIYKRTKPKTKKKKVPLRASRWGNQKVKVLTYKVWNEHKYITTHNEEFKLNQLPYGYSGKCVIGILSKKEPYTGSCEALKDKIIYMSRKEKRPLDWLEGFGTCRRLPKDKIHRKQ